MCRNTTKLQAHNPPILYNLWSDPGERDPLNEDDSLYYYILSVMETVCVIYINTCMYIYST